MFLQVKKLKNLFKLEISCKSAKFEEPSIGPTLSPYMVREKINLFCNEFNNLTQYYNQELRISVKLFLYIDNSFFFIIKGPNFSTLLKLLLNRENLQVLSGKTLITLMELYDMLYLKSIFSKSIILNIIKYNTLALKVQNLNAIYSVKSIEVQNSINR